MRDHTKLKIFELADALLVPTYQATRAFPAEEKYGLQSQIRRAAVSVPTNLVEGCTRRTQKDFLHFLSIAQGSAAEVCYLIRIAHRLEFIETEDLANRYDELVRAIASFVRVLEADQLKG